MNIKGFCTVLIAAVALSFSYTAKAQINDTVASVCAKHLTQEYISDGQVYRTLLQVDQTAEFHTTFYGGTTYRVAACSGLSDGNLIFTIKDPDGTVLFTNKDHKNAPYWDFKITSTVDCTIEAVLNPESAASGRAVILIGFKQ
ncbi:MAG TPA: hypothetical protein VI112_08475 [Bacteroidia bacterium]|jgi:hypothetical protein